jgi:hypothetical protein
MTKTYSVNYTEVGYGVMYVDASSPEEAVKLLEEGYGECDTVNYDNFEINWDILYDEDNNDTPFDWNDVEAWKDAYDTQVAYLKEEQSDLFDKWVEISPRIGDPEYALKEEILSRINKEAVRYANEQIHLLNNPIENPEDIGC